MNSIVPTKSTLGLVSSFVPPQRLSAHSSRLHRVSVAGSPGSSRHVRTIHCEAPSLEAAQSSTSPLEGILTGFVTKTGSDEASVAQQSEWENNVQIFEYTSAANPQMVEIPVRGLQPSGHRSGPTGIISLDISKDLAIEGYQATSPNLLASFLRVCVGESLSTSACATSQAFYVMHGEGTTQTPYGSVTWKTGDLFVIPGSQDQTNCSHFCYNDDKENTGGAGLYWVHDAPLLSYLGVVPRAGKFTPAFFRWEKLIENVEMVRLEAGSQHRNRLGILLGNSATPQTKTLTHTLWALLNALPAGQMQKPHRHNSVALDLAVYAAPGTYTLMGEKLDSNGNIINPLRVDWASGGMFITPPGWWHSHHNDSEEEAWVLPLQDAGLYTHQRTLDIRFVDQEVEFLKEGVIR